MFKENYKTTCKFIYNLKQRYFAPKNIYEANYPILILLSNLGMFSFKIKRCNREIQMIKHRKRIIIPTVFLVILTYIFFDYMLTKRIVFDQIVISKNIFYVIFLTQMGSGIICLLVFFPFSDFYFNIYLTFYKNIEIVDKCFMQKDIREILTIVKKYNLITTFLGLFFVFSISIHFGLATVDFKLCFGYFIPFIKILAMTYAYVNMVYNLRQRFRYINNTVDYTLASIEKRYNINNDPLRLKINITELKLKNCINMHSKLCDLLDDINDGFGVAVTVCVLALFIFILVDIFTRLTFLISNKNTLLSRNMIFGILWNLICQSCLSALSYHSNKLTEEV